VAVVAVGVLSPKAVTSTVAPTTGAPAASVIWPLRAAVIVVADAAGVPIAPTVEATIAMVIIKKPTTRKLRGGRKACARSVNGGRRKMERIKA